MYCPNCGTQNKEGAAFCTKCGNKLPQEQAPNPENLSAGASIPTRVDSVDQPWTPSKALVIAGFFVFAVAVVAFLMGSMGGVDLVRTVQDHQPFANSQGLPYTYEQVLNKYIQPVSWESGAIGEDKYAVIVSGKVKDTDNVISVQIDVSEDTQNPDNVYISPKNIQVAGISASDNEAVEIMLEMFKAYDAGLERLEAAETPAPTLEPTPISTSEPSSISTLEPADANSRSLAQWYIGQWSGLEEDGSSWLEITIEPSSANPNGYTITGMRTFAEGDPSFFRLSAVEDGDGLAYTGTDTANGHEVKGTILLGDGDTPNVVMSLAYDRYEYEIVMWFHLYED